MTTLVTGAAGFIGSHLLSELLDAGEAVVALDNLDGYYPVELKRRNLKEGSRGREVAFYAADLNDAAALDLVFSTHRIDAVAHLAGRGGVRPSVENPAAYVAANLSATISLCQAMERAGVRRIVFASTSAVYGADPTPWREEVPADRPLSPYAASKRAAELHLFTQSHLNRFDVTALRFFTVYGPRQRPDMALAKFIAAAQKGEPLLRYGDGQQLRDFTAVSDIVAGIAAALRRPPLPGRHDLINLGGGRPHTVNELIALVLKATGSISKIEPAPEQPGDVPRTVADISKAKKELGYEPKTDLENGVKNYLEWVKGNSAN